jgi:hypothetical protein
LVRPAPRAFFRSLISDRKASLESVNSFVRPRHRHSSAPTAVLTAAARRVCQGWPRLRGHPLGLGLDRPEHCGRLDWSGGWRLLASGRRCGRRWRSLRTCCRFLVPHFYRLEGKRKRETTRSVSSAHRLGAQSIIAEIDASNIAPTHSRGRMQSPSIREGMLSPPHRRCRLMRSGETSVA